VVTRRTALATGGVALLVAGCGGRPARTLAGDPHDLRILTAALEVERAQAVMYEVGLAYTSGRLAALVRTILAQERAHAAALEEAIRELGGAPAGPQDASDYRRGLPKSADAWHENAIQAEQRWSAGYAALIPKLTNQRLRSTFASLMTTEAEHAVALGVTQS
jgi:rubrerythrin